MILSTTVVRSRNDHTHVHTHACVLTIYIGQKTKAAKPSCDANSQWLLAPSDVYWTMASVNAGTKCGGLSGTGHTFFRSPCAYVVAMCTSQFAAGCDEKNQT